MSPTPEELAADGSEHPGPGGRGPGRRPGDPDTRADILAAARVLFGRDGYDRTSLRGIARQAGVDPGLIHHYFDGKTDLFQSAMNLPLDTEHLVSSVIDGPAEGLGERLARAYLTLWASPSGPAIIAVLRSATIHEDAARMLREFMTAAVLQPIAQRLSTDESPLRAALCASQLVGVGLLRHVIRFPPLHDADAEHLVDWLAPTLQRYLTDQSPGAAR